MTNERRQHPRYIARHGTYVSMLPTSTCMGQLMDVSIGGLSFRYIAHDGADRNDLETHVFLGDDSVYLDRLPTTVVEDTPLVEPLSSEFPRLTRRSARCVRQRRVRFESLSRDQRAQLTYFLTYRTDGRA